MKRPINKRLSAVLMTVGLASLAACSPEIGSGPTFNQEAGAQLDATGEFGKATVHNQLVQTCRTNGAAYAGKAGGTAGDPVVVLDPSSTVNRPVYRVHCNGRLDGNYARVVYGGYVSSATPTQSVQEADVE